MYKYSLEDRLIRILLILFVIGGCMNHPEYVEAKDVRFLEITKVNVGNTFKLHIKGFIFHSSLAVKAVDIKNIESNIWVMIKLKPTGKGLSGAFDFYVPIQSDSSVVVFGLSKTQIWPLLINENTN